MRIIFFSCKKFHRETAEVGGEAWDPVSYDMGGPPAAGSLEEGFTTVYHLTPGKSNRALGKKQKDLVFSAGERTSFDCFLEAILRVDPLGATSIARPSHPHIPLPLPQPRRQLASSGLLTLGSNYEGLSQCPSPP